MLDSSLALIRSLPDRCLSSIFVAVCLAPAAHAQLGLPDVLLNDPTGPSKNWALSVDLDGDRLAVGSPRARPATESVTIYERDAAGSWVVVADLVPSTSISESSFGTTVALEGDVLLVGAPGDDSVLTNAGAVFVFRRQLDGAWLETAVLRDPTPEVSGAFGEELDYDGVHAAVLEQKITPDSSDGSVTVFEDLGSSWPVRDVIGDPDPPSIPVARIGVALDGGWLVISSNTGRVRVYRRAEDATWPMAQELTNAVGANLDAFITRVAVCGSTVACSQGDLDDNRVVVYEHSELAGWQLSQTLSVDEFASALVFVGGVALSSSHLVVNSIGFHPFFSLQSFVHRKTPNDSWEYVEALRPGPSLYNWGVGIAVSEDRLATCFNVRDVLPPDAPRPVSIHELGSLFHGARELSAQGGGSQDLLLRAGSEHAGAFYALLGSASGTTPGLGDALGALGLPLVSDAYTDALVLGNGAGVVAPFTGVLDQDGKANAAVLVPPATDPSLVGTVLHHAFLVIDPTTFDVTHTSNAVRVELVP
ncbi:FG-GAP repeat protein [Rohdeia mirabilis]